jgi:hypothetical protein
MLITEGTIASTRVCCDSVVDGVIQINGVIIQQEIIWRRYDVLDAVDF